MKSEEEIRKQLDEFKDLQASVLRSEQAYAKTETRINQVNYIINWFKWVLED